MSRTKPITISAQLVPGRMDDDRLITTLCKDSVNLSAVIREALHLYLDKEEGKPEFEKEVLIRLDAIQNQRGHTAQVEKPKSNNPFLAATP